MTADGFIVAPENLPARWRTVAGWRRRMSPALHVEHRKGRWSLRTDRTNIPTGRFMSADLYIHTGGCRGWDVSRLWSLSSPSQLPILVPALRQIDLKLHLGSWPPPEPSAPAHTFKRDKRTGWSVQSHLSDVHVHRQAANLCISSSWTLSLSQMKMPAMAANSLPEGACLLCNLRHMLLTKVRLVLSEYKFE